MAIIKKGTYRWNDVLSLYVQTSFALPFYINGKFEDGTFDPSGITSFYGIEVLDNGTVSYYTNIDFNATITVYTEMEGFEWFWDAFYMFELADDINDERLKGWGQVITVTEDTEVDDDIASVFEAKTEPIEEKPTIDSLKAKLQALINKANEATGKGDVNLDNAVSNLVAGYGTGGGNHIIEVEELPTEGIVQTNLYKMDGTYYQYNLEFKDLVLAYAGETVSYIEMMESEGISVELYYAKTRPTDNIEVTTQDTFHIYYVEDEDDILAYGDFEESGTNAWASLSADMPYGGVITDISQITPSTEYLLYALVDRGWKPLGAAEYTGEVVIE